MSAIAVPEYADFLAGKARRVEAIGPVIDDSDIHPMLFPFQRAIVKWAVRKGRAAIFASTGLGKTVMQLEWARLVRPKGGCVLFVAPLSVAEQTQAEAVALGIDLVKVSRPTGDPYQVTNYEKLHHFVGEPYDAIILDESSRLKSMDGKQRTLLLEEFTGIKYRLCCTATPAPNDITELGNHSQFLGALPRREMLSRFFMHDSDKSAGDGWKLKRHGASAYFKWLASWAVYVRCPSDLGFDDGGYDLPDLTVSDETVHVDFVPEGQLFSTGAGGLTEAREARRRSLLPRVQRAAAIIAASSEQFVVWHDLNDEGRELARLLGEDCVHIEGATSDEDKVEREQRWRRGGVRVLVTKPAIYGWGLNWQHCHRVIFLGLSYSWESYFQAIRRCWRFGQKQPVDVRIVISEQERGVAASIERKEQQAETVAEEVVKFMGETMREEVTGERQVMQPYETADKWGDGWRMMLGDNVDRIKEITTDSIGLSVYSPPFAGLYVYSPLDRDMGNSADHDEFFTHYRFLIPELLRVTMPGRLTCVHVQQLTRTITMDGHKGLHDFRARVVQSYEDAGWYYDGEVVIDKCPQIQALRTRSHRLQFKQKNKDSSESRPALLDYILLFRKPGENAAPIKTDVSNDEWIKFARGIWYDINESDTLNVREARSPDDVRHVCPLQLETIRRCVRMWSNPGETVLSPFAGIGSEPFVALEQGRKAIGIELKPEYFAVACKNLAKAGRQQSLFEP